MVHSLFEKNPAYTTTDPQVVVQAAEQDAQVQALMDYVTAFQQEQPAIIPVKSVDRLEMVKTASIILADIQDGQLLLYTTTGMVASREPLAHLLHRLRNPDIVQVSKHAALNLNHLLTLTDSFSGNMIAELTDHVKTGVSRKYVKLLMQSLGV